MQSSFRYLFLFCCLSTLFHIFFFPSNYFLLMHIRCSLFDLRDLVSWIPLRKTHIYGESIGRNTTECHLICQYVYVRFQTCLSISSFPLLLLLFGTICVSNNVTFLLFPYCVCMCVYAFKNTEIENKMKISIRWDMIFINFLFSNCFVPCFVLCLSFYFIFFLLKREHKRELRKRKVIKSSMNEGRRWKKDWLKSNKSNKT